MRLGINLSSRVPWIGYMKYLTILTLLLLFYFVASLFEAPLTNVLVIVVMHILALLFTGVSLFTLFTFKESEAYYVDLTGTGSDPVYMPNKYLGIKITTRILLYLTVLSAAAIDFLVVTNDMQVIPPYQPLLILLISIICALTLYCFVKESKRVVNSEINWWSGVDAFCYREDDPMYKKT